MKDADKVNILMVDDQPGKLLTYEAILENLNENLFMATSAREALELMLRHDFAVILVDVCMPEQNGFELVETIREHHRFKDTAIIFVSAIQMDDMDRIRGYSSGAVDYVSVPIIPDILCAKVAVFADLYRKTKALERMNLELEERVAERTAKLREIEEALRETDRRKDVFLATLAHELRNPLAPIRSGLDLIKLSKGNVKITNEVCQVIDRQLNQLIRLVDDLLDINRINTGKLTLQKQECALSPIVQDAIEACRNFINAKGHHLEVTLPRENIMVNCDPTRLTQVFSNLIHNAAKYTDNGGLIEIDVKREDSKVRIRIKDNGWGIEPHAISFIFQMFSQVDGKRPGTNDGLGIGLSLVRGLIGIHGGTVTAKSEGLGKGSEFSVVLPIENAPFRGLDFDDGDTEKAQLPSRRILVVDDNEDVSHVLSKMLDYMGNETHTANNGVTGLALVDSLDPDVVFLDLGMPGMDGFEVARKIRSTRSHSRPMIVALTGWSSEDDRKKTDSAGFDLHLRKPIEIEELTALFESLEAMAN